MGVPFKTGSLPDPLRKPQGSEDEVAAALAKLVSVRDEQSVPALLAAIMAAGFGVRDSDGSVTQTLQPGQGLVFEAWEVAAMAKMYGEKRSVELSSLTGALKSIPDLKQAALDKIVLDGIRANAESNQPMLRFWARFIVELARHSDEPYDMLAAAANPSNVRLDAIQAALVLRRLFGDIYAFSQRGKQAYEKFRRFDVRNHDAIARAEFHVGSPRARSLNAHARVTQAPQGSQPPCHLEDGEDTVADVRATAITTAFNELIEFAKKKIGGSAGDLFGSYASFADIANILLAYAKFVATYAALETEITVENPPLVRNTDVTPGQPRRLTAKVTMNIGKWQQVNCIRWLLNAGTGMDFNLLNDGPLGGVEVNWHLVEGGGADFYATGERGQQIVRFVGTGPRIQDAGTYAGAGGRSGIQVGILTRTKTDVDGKAQITLEGASRRNYVRAPYSPVMKQAVVRTTIKLKGGDIKEDAGDITGHVLGSFIKLGKGKGLSGSAEGWFMFPLELLYRTDWASTATVTIPVKDWEPCEEAGWEGTISHSVKRTITNDFGNPATGFIHLFESSYNFDASINLRGGKATGTAQAVEAFMDLQDTGPHPYRTKSTVNRKGTASYSGELEASVNVDSYGNYGVGFRFPEIMGTSEQTVEHIHPRKNSTATSSNPWQADEYVPSIKGTVNPNNPNVINDSRTWRSNDGQTDYKFTVKLVRCQ